MSTKNILSVTVLLLALSFATHAHAQGVYGSYGVSVQGAGTNNVNVGFTGTNGENNQVNVSNSNSANVNANTDANTNTTHVNFTNHQGTQTSVNVRTSDGTNAKSKAQAKIDERIAALTKLSTRVNGMVKVSASVKTNLQTNIQTEISNLNALKAKIEADTDASILKTDILSITGNYRIYALVIPQGAILAEADRQANIASALTILGTKLQARINAAQSAGKDVTSLQSTYQDMTAKISDANAKASLAISTSASLTPDNGNGSEYTANKQALQDARASLKTGESDLKIAYADAKSIVARVQGTGSTNVTVSGSQSTNISVTQ